MAMETPTIILPADRASEILKEATRRVREHTQAPEKIATGDDPTARFPIPDMMFGVFSRAPELERVGEAILDANRVRFAHLWDNPQGPSKFAWLWKTKGGSVGGKAKMAAIQPVAGLVEHFSGVDFVVWVAWDHLRLRRPLNWQVEALLYHELLHIDADEAVDKMTGETIYGLKMRGHDAELFIEEVERYGLWHRDLERVGDAFGQMSLFDDEGGGE